MSFVVHIDVIHTSCLVSHIKSFPSHTAPAGYVCPTCNTSVSFAFYLWYCLDLLKLEYIFSVGVSSIYILLCYFYGVFCFQMGLYWCRYGLPRMWKIQHLASIQSWRKLSCRQGSVMTLKLSQRSNLMSIRLKLLNIASRSWWLLHYSVTFGRHTLNVNESY